MAWEQGLTVSGCYVGGVFTTDENGRARGQFSRKGPTGQIERLGPCREQGEREFDLLDAGAIAPPSGDYTLSNNTFPNNRPYQIKFSFNGDDLSGEWSRTTNYVTVGRVETRLYTISGKMTRCIGFLRGVCYSALMRSRGDTWRILFGFTGGGGGNWTARGAYWNRYDAATGFAHFRLQGVSETALEQQAPSTAAPMAAARSLSFSSLGGFDSYVRSSVPTAVWSGEPTILVGGWGDEYRGLLKFNIGAIPVIADGGSVKLRLYVRSPDDGTAFRSTTMAVYRALSSFSANTSWQNQPSIDRDTERLVEVSREGWIEIDITSYVESWQAGAPNNGIVLVPLNTNNKFNMFVSSNDAARRKFWPTVEINR